MAATARSILVVACLLISSCSDIVTATTTEPLQSPAEPSTTTEPLPPPTGLTTTTSPATGSSDGSSSGLSWSTVDLDFGVSEITAVGSGLVGLAVQDFNAPSSLIDEDDTGCVGFQAGRTGEVVWSTEGGDWAPLPTQPSWYRGPLSPEDWGAAVASGSFPPITGPVELVSHGDQLLAISFDELTRTRATAVVDASNPSTIQWDRLESLGPVGSNTSAMAAVTGPDGILIVAARPDVAPSVWKVSERSLVELPGAFGSWPDTDESWVDEVTEIELIASADGYLAQFEIPARPPVMAYSVDGSSWTRVGNPSVGAVHLAASGGTVLAANWEGMWVSRDGGRSWTLVPIEEDIQLIEITGSDAGFAAWFLSESWSSPTVWFSVDGVDWQPILELSNDYNWINGLIMTDEEMIVSVSVPGNGWVCPDIERYGYEIHILRFE